MQYSQTVQIFSENNSFSRRKKIILSIPSHRKCTKKSRIKVDLG